jgi:NAD(P)H dehydrogenase (quinone)
MIIVTGATGQLGRAIVEQLVTRLPPEQVGASVRDPARAADLEARGVRVRRGDFADPASLAHAFEGATQVLMVSSNAAAYGGDTMAQHRAAIDAARAAGARRIVYTSHMGASPASRFAPMPDHAATEDLLAASGVRFTSLRNGFYATTPAFLLRGALATGVLATPADGPVSWTAHADLAEAAAILLTDGGPDGPTPALTGAESLDLTAVAAIASEVVGRPITRTVVPAEEYRAGLIGHGVPADAAQMLLGMFAASREGEFATVDPCLERLLGRRPTSLREVLTAALQAPPAG